MLLQKQREQQVLGRESLLFCLLQLCSPLGELWPKGNQRAEQAEKQPGIKEEFASRRDLKEGGVGTKGELHPQPVPGEGPAARTKPRSQFLGTADE